MKIFPNPAHNFLYFTQPLQVHARNSKVFDAVGKEVKVNINKNGIDACDLSSGFYIAIIERAMGQTTLRFIKK